MFQNTNVVFLNTFNAILNIMDANACVPSVEFIYSVVAKSRLSLIARFIGANTGPIWGRQDPGGPHVGPMNHAIKLCASRTKLLCQNTNFPLEYLINVSSSMELKLYPDDI